MGKTKRRESSETEYLRGKVKKLESENRQLKKRLKQLDRQSHFFEEIVDDVVEDIQPTNICPSCKKGTLIFLDFKYVKYEKCDNCDYRKKQ